MLALTHGLRSDYEFQGKTYPLDLSFDNVLRYYELLDDETYSDAEKIITAFEMFFGQKPTDEDTDLVVQGFEDVTKFISLKPYGDDEDSSEGQDGQTVTNPRKFYSFKQDAEAIYASFIEQYGIDLIDEQGKLHWDKFKALFQGLGPNTYFQRIIAIRQKDTKDLKGEELAHVIEAQQFYELDENKTQAAKEQQMAAFAQTIKSWALS